MNATIFTPSDQQEDGFTLIEILVVIIIIGILAAIAIPIFLNQQRTARDSATQQDVRNLVSAVETSLAAEPEATYFYLAGAGPDSTNATVRVGTGPTKAEQTTPITISKTEGTMLILNPSTAEGEPVLNAEGLGVTGAYVARGYNEDGQEHKTREGALLYSSNQGGFQ